MKCKIRSCERLGGVKSIAKLTYEVFHVNIPKKLKDKWLRRKSPYDRIRSEILW